MEVEEVGLAVAIFIRLAHQSRAMPTRHLPFILLLLALPTLAACGSSGQIPEAVPPPSAESLAALAEEPGVGRERLARAIDGLFDAEAVGETRAFLILHGGEIVAERYAPGFDKDMRFPGWSMSQCLTGIMVGLLVSDGRLRLNETAPVPTWQRSGDPRGEITLKQLLQMSSGLRHEETADPAHRSDKARMLFLDGRDNMAAYAEAQPLKAEPGQNFEFSSASSIILADIAASVLTDSSRPDVRRKAVTEYLRSRLLDPAGMTSVLPEFDAAGTMIGSSMIHASARDWAKLGEFLRHGGSVRGAQVISRRWIEFMRTPSPSNSGYGAQLWLNNAQPEGEEVLFPGKAPDSLFACIGEHGQYVIGSPRQKITVVRLGRTVGEQRTALRDRLGDIVALFPAS